MWLFHLLNLQGNLTPTDFYRSLEQLTDSRKLQKLPVSLRHIFDHVNILIGTCVGSIAIIHEHCAAVA